MFEDKVYILLSDYYAVSREDVEKHVEDVIELFQQAADGLDNSGSSEFGQIDGNDKIMEGILKMDNPKLAFQIYSQVVAILGGM